MFSLYRTILTLTLSIKVMRRQTSLKFMIKQQNYKLLNICKSLGNNWWGYGMFKIMNLILINKKDDKPHVIHIVYLTFLY